MSGSHPGLSGEEHIPRLSVRLHVFVESYTEEQLTTYPQGRLSWRPRRLCLPEREQYGAGGNTYNECPAQVRSRALQ